MPKSAIVKSAIVKTTTSIKSKRPKGDKRSTPKVGFLTEHHPESADLSQGFDERKEVLKWRAMELKIQGFSLRQIALQLQEDFELIDAPSYATIDLWLDNAFAETVTAKQLNAERHCAVLFTRAEAVIASLVRVAMGKVIIRRTRIRDGQEIEIIDENALHEQIAAASEMRKYMDHQAKLLKIYRPEDQGDKGGAITGHSLTVLIEQTVTDSIAMPGQTPKAGRVTLLLESGDEDIDALDAEAIVERIQDALPAPI